MSLTRLWYKYSPQILIGELLEKRWMEAFVPFVLMLLVVIGFAVALPQQMTTLGIQSLSRDFAPIAFVTFAMAISVLAGGIDLSVGAIFAMANFVAIYVAGVLGLSIPVTIVVTLAFGIAVGAVNGFLIAYLRTRPFLTTIVALIILRAIYDKLVGALTLELSEAYIDNPLWDFMGRGFILGVPFAAACLVILGICLHLYLSRLRPGLHLMALGSSRKAARHAGIKVRLIIFSAYVISGLLCSVAGLLYAARQNSAGTSVGLGWEITALAAVVLGGISLNGGRGSIARAAMGAIAMFLIVNGLVQTGVPGGLNSAVVGGLLLIAMGFNVKWAKNKALIAQKVYVSPTWVGLSDAPSIAADSGTSYAINDRLSDAAAIGLNQIEGPEDVIFDRQGRIYTGTRNGYIIRFSGPDFSHREEFARIGGRPLGLAMDRDENLIVCVVGMGVYGVTPERKVFKITDQTKRSLFSIKDDSRIHFADDLDIAPDGRIYFSQATDRYEEWGLDGVEGRGNGRILCYDPASKKTTTVVKRIPFPNGVCTAHDGQSVLFCSTWLCRVYRHWIGGPKAGTTEILVDNLPGYPDNINRASDGTYWLALAGLRSPVYDLAMASPEFRLRMVKRIPRDEWLVPGLNYGAVAKVTEDGTVLESLWDGKGLAHSTVTSMREHKGWLYIGGLENNRIGRIRLDGADETWTSWDSYWGTRGSKSVKG